jgi:hypothetical protein
VKPEYKGLFIKYVFERTDLRPANEIKVNAGGSSKNWKAHQNNEDRDETN